MVLFKFMETIYGSKYNIWKEATRACRRPVKEVELRERKAHARAARRKGIVLRPTHMRQW